MTQQLTSPPRITSSPFAPAYRSDLTRTIGVLQQLQVLCTQGDTSLSDVIRVVRDMQSEFGESCLLETVIQSLVGQHLSQQLITRRLARQLHHVEAMEVRS